MNKINLVYWSENNFGDALSPMLIEELSGNKIQLKHAYKNKFRRFAKALLYLSPKELNAILFPWQNNILGVGSVICCGNNKSKVWGAGFMSNFGVFNGGEIHAVRGPYTAKRLTEQGFRKCEIYGDPALLLPLWKQPSSTKIHKIGIVPHWKESDIFEFKYGMKYKIIDLRTRDTCKVVDEITSCEYILSTSLHGLIVAHAYQIPALWIKEGDIETDGFKFADYFSSVGIPEYVGFEHVDKILSSNDQWLSLFENHRDKSLINFSLKDIQKNLLDAAPFSLKEKYKRIFNAL